LGLLIVAFYDVFGERQADFMKMIESYPPEFLAFFGTDAKGVMSPEGYLGMYGFSFLPIIIGFFAVMAGSNLIAGDEERGRLDLVIAHPVGRTAFFFGRVIAFIGAAISILLVGWLGFCVMLNGSSLGITWGEMALPFVSTLAQGLIYGTLALLLSMVFPAKNYGSIIAGLLMVVGYIMSSMASLNENIATFARYFPYTYFQGSEAFTNLNRSWLLALFGVSIGMLLLAWWRFVRRDIRLSGEGNFRLQTIFSIRQKTS
ncbi:MAG TPA: ABC transporter permease subunit, partial [Anaerolineales bacterium]|nr:ABC transporter permease subunit [Anaerolineales bacterium]